jgi:hypothetical protein
VARCPGAAWAIGRSTVAGGGVREVASQLRVVARIDGVFRGKEGIERVDLGVKSVDWEVFSRAGCWKW